MSGHLIGCVKRIKDLPTSHKLALVAFADSGDDRTHIALPGYEGVMEWAGCSRGRAAELIRDLVTWNYLKQHKRGHRGQRAEYIVFPDGCCELHRTPVPETPPDVDQLARAAGVSTDQARLMLSALGTSLPPATDNAPAPEKGSGAAGPIQAGKGPEQPDPISAAEPTPAAEAPAQAGKGPERISGSGVNANAVTPSTTSPQPPPASRQGSRCAKHPNGHSNCRGCGTTPRQLAAVAQRAATEQRRAAQQAQAAKARAARAATTPPSPEAIRAAKEAARAAVAAAKTRTPRKAGR